jgi:hypothetical protein
VGLRKVIGSNRWQLIKQFFGESLMYTLAALGLSLFFIRMILPAFNSYVQRNIELKAFSDPGALLMLGAVVLFCGLVSGIYPALFLSSFQPIRIIRGAIKSDSKTPWVFRNVIVVVQFTFTIFLITSSAVIMNQLNFLKNKSFASLGQQVVYISLTDGKIRKNCHPLKNELLQNSQIVEITASYNLPISIPTGSSVSL